MSDTNKRSLQELSDNLQGHPALPADARELLARLVAIVGPLDAEAQAAQAEGSQG